MGLDGWNDWAPQWGRDMAGSREGLARAKVLAGSFPNQFSDGGCARRFYFSGEGRFPDTRFSFGKLYPPRPSVSLQYETHTRAASRPPLLPRPKRAEVFSASLCDCPYTPTHAARHSSRSDGLLEQRASADSERIQRDDKARTYFQGLLTMRKWTSMKHLEVQSSKGEVSLRRKGSAGAQMGT